MTDETTARDRAIEAAKWLALLASTHGATASNEHAQEKLDEVLRALAGAPTADVAETDRLREKEEAALLALSHTTSSRDAAEKRVRDLEAEAAQLREVKQRACEVVRCWEDDERIDAAFDALRALLAAAPEGVDAADELRAEADGGSALDRAIRLLAANGYVAVYETARKQELSMLNAAQGDVADELTAAQAAIQRVRELADEWAQSGAPVLTNLAAHLLRALDGDTTEEAP